MNSFEHQQLRNHRDRWPEPARTAPSVKRTMLTLTAIAGALGTAGWALQSKSLGNDHSQARISTQHNQDPNAATTETEQLIQAVLTGAALVGHSLEEAEENETPE